MSDNVERFVEKLDLDEAASTYSYGIVFMDAEDVRAMLRVIRAAAEVDEYDFRSLRRTPDSEDWPDVIAAAENLEAALTDLPGGEPAPGGKDGSDD